MRRPIWLAAALVLAFALAVLSSRSPAPAPADAPADAFSAARAMVDVRRIAQAPHPVGSTEHGRVESWLTARMAELGLSPEVQTGPLSPAAARRLEGWGVQVTPDLMVRNLVGVLPGQDRAAPALLLMAHYDTVPGSPGAADDSAGVAAILEAVRALKARGQLPRDLIVLFTDAEELNLDGARVFFGGHPLRDRVGAVINLEARGGGGRALMFETGHDDADVTARYAAMAARVSGGVSGNSLAVLVYGMMPHGTDFTIARDRGLAGMNFAFIGRPAHYHAPDSTPDSLDMGALQHLGEQALEAAVVLAAGPAETPAGPRATAESGNTVFSDVFGRVVLGHSPATGWLILGLALGLTAFTAWRVRASPADIGRGVLDGLWFLGAGVAAAGLARLPAGPTAVRAESADLYYALLRRLPWIEAAAALAVLAVAALLLAGRQALRPRHRRMVAAGLALITLLAMIPGGFDPFVLGALVVALALTWPDGLAARTAWGGALGLAALVLALGAVVQGFAPQAAFVLLWPALAGAAGWALAAGLDPRLERTAALACAAAPAAVAGGWLMAMGHAVFLGVGADMPGVLALLALPVLALIRPLAPGPADLGIMRALRAAAPALLGLALLLSAAARFIHA